MVRLLALLALAAFAAWRVIAVGLGDAWAEEAPAELASALVEFL